MKTPYLRNDFWDADILYISFQCGFPSKRIIKKTTNHRMKFQAAKALR